MTLLRDLYRTAKPLRSRIGRSGWDSEQSIVTDPSLLGTAPSRTSENARHAMESRAFETLFLADWANAVFLHFEVDRNALQEEVPFQLDEFDGNCFVSFVAFTMRKMRFAKGGHLTRWLTAPIATHRFLNLRTYVRHNGQDGIFFMKEWLDNPLSIPLGPRTFGLPYHLGKLSYDHATNAIAANVDCKAGTLRYRGTPEKDLFPAEPDTLSAFLLERYTAFTAADRRRKFFRVWHEPWQQAGISNFAIEENTLFEGLDAAWTKTARFVAAHFSPGANDVRMGRPHFA